MKNISTKEAGSWNEVHDIIHQPLSVCKEKLDNKIVENSDLISLLFQECKTTKTLSLKQLGSLRSLLQKNIFPEKKQAVLEKTVTIKSENGESFEILSENLPLNAEVSVRKTV